LKTRKYLLNPIKIHSKREECIAELAKGPSWLIVVMMMIMMISEDEDE